jgi:hypothetical protein
MLLPEKMLHFALHEWENILSILREYFNHSI